MSKLDSIYEKHCIPIGTAVSAKFRGAFCEATINGVDKIIECRIQLNDKKSIKVNVEEIIGDPVLNQKVKLKSQNGFQNGLLVKIMDNSLYHVVFNDDDTGKLRRNQLVLKGDRHFKESECLDKHPLTNPEHFTRAVVADKSNKDRSELEDEDFDVDDQKSCSQESQITDSSSKTRFRPLTHTSSPSVGTVTSSMTTKVAEEPKIQNKIIKSKRGPNTKYTYGTLVIVYKLGEELGNIAGQSEKVKKFKPFVALIVSPQSVNKEFSEIRVSQCVIKSFQTDKWYLAYKKDLELVTERDKILKCKELNIQMGSYIEKCFVYFDLKILPENWDKDSLLSISTKNDSISNNEGNQETKRGNRKVVERTNSIASSISSISDNGDDDREDLSDSRVDDDDEDEESNENDDEKNQVERDEWVARFFGFWEHTRSPVNSEELMIEKTDLDIHKLFKLVTEYGGYQKATSTIRWPTIYLTMKLTKPCSDNYVALQKIYKKYIYPFVDMSKKLGDSFDQGRATRKSGSDAHKESHNSQQSQQQPRENPSFRKARMSSNSNLSSAKSKKRGSASKSLTSQQQSINESVIDEELEPPLPTTSATTATATTTSNTITETTINITTATTTISDTTEATIILTPSVVVEEEQIAEEKNVTEENIAEEEEEEEDKEEEVAETKAEPVCEEALDQSTLDDVFVVCTSPTEAQGNQQQTPTSPDSVPNNQQETGSNTTNFLRLTPGTIITVAYGDTGDVYKAKIVPNETPDKNKKGLHTPTSSIDEDCTSYKVHYIGWNPRHDEIIGINRIVSVISHGCDQNQDNQSSCSSSTKQSSTNKQTNQVTGPPSIPDIKMSDDPIIQDISDQSINDLKIDLGQDAEIEVHSQEIPLTSQDCTESESPIKLEPNAPNVTHHKPTISQQNTSTNLFTPVLKRKRSRSACLRPHEVPAKKFSEVVKKESLLISSLNLCQIVNKQDSEIKEEEHKGECKRGVKRQISSELSQDDDGEDSVTQAKCARSSETEAINNEKLLEEYEEDELEEDDENEEEFEDGGKTDSTLPFTDMEHMHLFSMEVSSRRGRKPISGTFTQIGGRHHKSQHLNDHESTCSSVNTSCCSRRVTRSLKNCSDNNATQNPLDDTSFGNLEYESQTSQEEQQQLSSVSQKKQFSLPNSTRKSDGLVPLSTGTPIANLRKSSHRNNIVNNNSNNKVSSSGASKNSATTNNATNSRRHNIPVSRQRNSLSNSSCSMEASSFELHNVESTASRLQNRPYERLHPSLIPPNLADMSPMERIRKLESLVRQTHLHYMDAKEKLKFLEKRLSEIKNSRSNGHCIESDEEKFR